MDLICSNPSSVNHKQRCPGAKSTHSPGKPSWWSFINSFPGEVQVQPCQPPQGHQMPGPSLSPGVTATDPQHLQQHPLNAKTDFQRDFQIPSATSLIQTQPFLPAEVSKINAQIQKGGLFPANNYPAFLQLSLSHPENHKSLTNASANSQDLQPTE